MYIPVHARGEAVLRASECSTPHRRPLCWVGTITNINITAAAIHCVSESSPSRRPARWPCWETIWRMDSGKNPISEHYCKSQAAHLRLSLRFAEKHGPSVPSSRLKIPSIVQGLIARPCGGFAAVGESRPYPARCGRERQAETRR